jgi:hypothetical protein
MSTSASHPKVVLLLPDHVPDAIKAVRATAQSMQQNAASFPGSAALLTKLTTDVDALDAAETAVHTGPRGAAATRDQKLDAVKADMTQILAVVQAAINENPAAAESLAAAAALHLGKTHGHGAQEHEVLEGEVSGSIKCRAPSAGVHAAYNWQISLDGGKTWGEPTTTTVAHTSFNGLTPGVTVLVRSRSTVKDVTSDWSAPVSFMVR